MGGANSSNAVVDSKGRVYGVHALRIVDSSTFLLLPPGHPQATVCEFQCAIISKDPGLILTYDRYACGKACPGHHRRQLIVKLKGRCLQEGLNKLDRCKICFENKQMVVVPKPQ